MGTNTSDLILPPLGISAPIRFLERLWMDTSCAYAVLDETLMEDTLWDQMAEEMWQRKTELSAPFCNAVGLPYPVPADYGEAGENPLKTTMGVNWDVGLPAVFTTSLRIYGPAPRVAMYQQGYERIVGAHLLRTQ